MKNIPRLKYLSYFLETYWHQMSNEIYNNIEEAANEFINETDEYRVGLAIDIRIAEEGGLFAEDYGSPVYKTSFWSQFSRLIRKSEAQALRLVMEGSESTR